MLIDRLIVGPIEENCYIVGDEETRRGVIIDPGDEPERIVGTVRGLGLKVDTIFNTHAHVDHICAAQDVKEQLGARLYLHPGDEMYLPDLVEHAAMFGMHKARRPTVDVWMADGDRIECGTLEIAVTHAPGHTPGHCLLTIGEDVFCGDLIFAGSIGRTDLPGGNYEQIIASLESTILTLPEPTRLHPGHGESTTVAVERRLNPFLRGLSPRRRSRSAI
ncbi:MAG: MBL fold metallo-hydrolase [candidate division Zixibacteria bacterium]|nr:MBL fold metallo-hydrolase [candidate division Zixibacteria bacterium]